MNSPLCRVQSLFNALGAEVSGKALALGGDGRYFGPEAAQIIIKLAVSPPGFPQLPGQSTILPYPNPLNLLTITIPNPTLDPLT